MAVVKWSNVAVAFQSALTPVGTSISGITKANPGVVTTSVAHTLANGDYVLLSVVGMYQVDGRVFRVAGSTSTTFQLEGEDTSLYDTFSSGTVSKITFGTTMSTATGLTASGGDFDFIDTTTIHVNTRTQVPGLASPATYTFENLWDPADTALLALKTASDNQVTRCARFTFAGGQKVLFNGYVGATLLPTGNAQDKVQTNVTVTMFGKPTIYAT
jgi:hypothetical protein